MNYPNSQGGQLLGPITYLPLFFLNNCSVKIRHNNKLKTNLETLSVIQDLSQVPPSIESTRRRIVTVTEGGIASLPCNSQGYPPPKISWIHDGRTMIHNGEKHQIQQSGTLTIANVQVCSNGYQDFLPNCISDF